MKNLKMKLFLTGFVFALGTVAIISCEKDELNQEESDDKVIESNYVIAADGGSFCIHWDEWGHSADTTDDGVDNSICTGWGLCNLTFSGGLVSPGNYSSPLVYDNSSDSYHIDVLRDEFVPTDEDLSTLPLFEPESVFNPELGVTYTILPGDYPFDPLIGDMGGYRLPVTVE